MTFGNSSSNSPQANSDSLDEHTWEWNYHESDIMEDELDEPETVTDGALIDDTFRQTPCNLFSGFS
jgi:hypothetical protein